MIFLLPEMPSIMTTIISISILGQKRFSVFHFFFVFFCFCVFLCFFFFFLLIAQTTHNSQLHLFAYLLLVCFDEFLVGLWKLFGKLKVASQLVLAVQHQLFPGPARPVGDDCLPSFPALIPAAHRQPRVRNRERMQLFSFELFLFCCWC